MADWWEKYKKDRNLGGNKKSSSKRTWLKKEVSVTDENRQTAKSSTWWEDYKKTRDLDSKVAANRQRAERSQRFASANRQLDENRSRDAAEDEIRELFRNPFSSDAEWQAGVLQRNAERYKRDLPLYQQAMQNSSTWGEYFSAHRQAGESQSAVKHQFERYQQATQKAEQDRNESNLVNRPAQWQAENLTPQEIEQRLAYYRSEAATPTVTDRDREEHAYLYPEAALQKVPHGARFDERLLEGAGQDAIDALYRPILTEQEKAAVEEADRQIIEEKASRNYEQVQRLLAAQAGQTETASRARGNELIEEIAQGGEAANRAKTGKAMFEQQQKKIDDESPTIIYGAHGNYSRAMAERTKRGYILGSDWDNVPEDRKQAVYALFTESPEKAIELAKYYIADVRQAEDEEQQAWYAQSGLTSYLGLAASAAAHLGSAVDPFGPVGQELTRYGDNALAGGSQWVDAATDYKKIPEWVPIVGGKGAGDFYQTVGSVVQSAAVAAPAILAGRYDKAAAEIVGKLGLVLMGSSAAASDYRESVAAGMDEDRAKLHALAAGVEEALFEEVSLDKLIKMDTSGGLKAALKNWLVQSGIEGSEELATSIANRITDEMISGAGQSKVERRASELIANGMNSTQAHTQAESEWMTDTLYEGFSGFLSGGMMTGGNYALQGLANLKERAVSAAETRKVQKQAGAAVSRSEGSVEALQAYAKDKGIEIREVETADQNAEQGEQSAAQNSYSNRDYRSISDTNSKVVQSIRSEVRGKTVQEQQTIRDSLVEKYGEGIAPVVNHAISVETASRVRQEYGDVDSIQAARSQAVKEIKDESLRRAVSDGYDSAAYSLAASQGGEGGMNTMSRYIQQRNNTGTGEMSMNATVTAQDGSTKAIAITGMSEDGKRVSLADGSEVAVKDLQADADTTSAIQQLADLDLGADATKVLQAYQQSGVAGTDGYRWLMDYATAYNQGRTRQISLEQAAQRSSLDERTVMDAYTLGQQAANRETQAGLEKLKNLPKRKGANGRTANIDTTEIKGKTMSKSEIEQFELANQYAQALGVDMKWFSSKEKDGKFVGKNGAYENGKIYMDIHAGRNFAADLTSGILATMGHELSHFEQQYAPEEYQALKEFLFEQIVKSSPNGEARLERLIWEKQKRSGNTLSRKAAEDEVVADACQKMLRDSKTVHDFASQQPEAANGVVRWLDKWFKRVRSIFGRGGNYSEEAQLMDSLEQDVKAAFGELWDKALKQAIQVHDEVGNIGASTIRGIEETGASEQMAEEAVVQNSDRLDDETLRFLDNQEHVTVYRAMQMIDGKLYPPMAAKVEGKLVDATELGEWYQAVERPDLIDPKTGKWKLDKANGKAIKAAYNPYFHTSATPLNDQFSSAYKRPNIVVVEGIIPKSELTSGYKAQYAKDSVGETKWHAGPVASKLKGAKSRRVFLSRWFQAQRVVSDAEVADVVAKTLEGENIAVPNNVVTPSLLEALRERGVAIDEDAIDRFESKHGMRQNSDRDTEYLELAKDPEKNAAKLQEMVDEAAMLAGYTIRAYHGTGGEFNSFDLQRSGSNSKELVGDSAEGMFFFSSIREAYPGSAQDYARIAGKKTGQEVIRDVYLKMENPLELDSKGWYATADYYDNNRDSIYDQYLSGDYDGIIIRDSSGGDDNTIYLLDDANRIKSAETVVYDDQGNLIPLSERFNPDNPDIRYSERDYSTPSDEELLDTVQSTELNDAEQKRLLTEYQTLRRQIKSMEKRLETLEENRAKLNEKIQGGKEYSEKYVSIKDKEIENLRREIETSREYLQEKMLTPKLADLLKAQRRNAAAKAKQQKEAQFARYKEGKKAGELRRRIVRHSKELYGKLTKPSDKRHIPEAYRGAVAALLNTINLESAYDIQEGTKKESGRGGKHVEKGTGTATNRTKAFQEVRKQLEKVLAEGGFTGELINNAAEGFDGGLIEKCQDFADKPISTLSAEELETLWNTIRALEHNIATFNKAFALAKTETISGIADKFLASAQKRKPLLRDPKSRLDLTVKKTSGLAMKALENPYTFFSHYGEEGVKLFRALRDTQDLAIVRTYHLADLWVRKMANILGDEKTAKLNGDKLTDAILNKIRDTSKQMDEKVETFRLANGQTITLTHAMLMDVYLLAQRGEVGMNHLLGSGLIQPEIRAKGKYVARDPSFRKLSLEDVQKMTEVITENATEKAVADAIQSMQHQLADWGNEASMDVFGYRKFTEDNYWPVKNAKEENKSDSGKGGNQPANAMNKGMAKNLVPHAATGMEPMSAFTKLQGSISDMLVYATWGPVMEDFKRLYNWKWLNPEGGTSDTVKGVMERYGGEGSQRYWEELRDQINNGIGGGKSIVDQFIGKTVGAVKGARVAFNLRVVAQQPTAYARAGEVISGKYLAASLLDIKSWGWKAKSAWNRALTHSPIAMRKDSTTYDMGGNISVGGEFGLDRPGRLDKARDFGTALAGKADAITWGRLWHAAELQVSAKTNLEYGSQEYWGAVNKLFTEAVDRTQVVDGLLQRPAIMRTDSDFVKGATSYMGEPLMQLNMLMRQFNDFRQTGLKATKKQIGKTVTALVVTQLINAMLTGLYDAGIRKDDEDKDFWERFMAEITGLDGTEENAWDYITSIWLESNVASEVSVMQKIPLLKDVLSMLQGYDPSNNRMDLEAVKDLIDVCTKVLWNDKYTPLHKAKEIINKSSMIFGAGFGNALKDMYGVTRNIVNDFGNPKARFDFKALWLNPASKKNKSQYFDLLFQMLENGDKDAFRQRAKELAGQDGMLQFVAKAAIERYLADGLSPEDVWDMMEAARDDGMSDEKFYDYAHGRMADAIKKSYLNRKLEDDQAITLLMQYAGKDEKDAWNAVRKWADNAEHTDEDGELEDGYKYSAYNDLFEAVDANQDAEKVIKEMVQNGGYEADNLRGKIKEHLRERFIAGEITETALKNQLSRYCKITKAEDANEIVKNAKCKRDFGVYPDDLKEAFKDGNLSQNQAVKALQQYNGLSKTDAQNRVQYWGYDGDLSENAWLKWNKDLKGSGLSAENWEKVSKVKNNAKGIDANGDGKADYGTAKAEVVSYIDSMNIPKSQKKAIYLAFGWAASTMPNWR